MDVYSGKRAVSGIPAPRRGSGHALRDTDGSRDGPVQFCSRLGCSGRINYLKGTQNNCLEKPKPMRPFFRSSYGKEVLGSSSKNCSSATNSSKSLQEPRKKLSSKMERNSRNSRSILGEPEIQENSSTNRNHAELKSKSRYAESNKAVLMPVGKRIEEASSNSKIRNGYRQKSGLSIQGAQIGSSDNGRRKNIVKERFIEEERGLSARGKKISEPSSSEGRVSLSAYGLSVPDSRHSRNRATCRGSGNGVPSVRTRRSVNVDTALHGNSSSLDQSTNVTPDVPQTEIRWFSAESSSSGSSLDGGHATNDDLLSVIPVTSTNRSVVSFTDCNGSRRYNIDGIADVLLALERIEQDEELTYEQLLSLEANPFLGGLHFYDQHRDMRLDIDNMSYEELLALEEKMGTVSTALSEEKLSKCLSVSIYKPLHLKQRRTKCSSGLDDAKCSICQEEFTAGDEVGKLGCTHGYHAACINQWLQLKNWCPVCKASAEPSESSSVSS